MNGSWNTVSASIGDNRPMSFRDFIVGLSNFQGALPGHDGQVRKPKPLLNEKDRAYAEVLAALGVVKVVDDAVRIADREISGAFVKQFAFWAEKGLPPFGDPASDPRSSITQVLRAMVEHRLDLFPDEMDELRLRKVEQLLLIGAYGDQRFILLGEDLVPRRAWSRFKLLGVRTEGTEPFKKALVAALGRGAGEIRLGKEIKEKVSQVSATRGPYSKYPVSIYPAARIPKETCFVYGKNRRLVWMTIDDLEWGLQTYPDLFFPKVFENREVRKYIRDPNVTYLMEPRDLEGRRVQRSSVEILRSDSMHEESQLRRSSWL